MSPSRSAPPVDLAMLLNQAAYAVGNRLSAALEDLGVSVRGYCVLAKASEGERTQRELADQAFMDKTTMVVTLDELERNGLAERRLAPADRRVRVVALTPAGRRLLTKADRRVREVYDDVLGDVEARERDVFIEVLDSLVSGPLASPFHLEQPARVRRRRATSAA